MNDHDWAGSELLEDRCKSHPQTTGNARFRPSCGRRVAGRTGYGGDLTANQLGRDRC
jgi:hypothetical protein